MKLIFHITSRQDWEDAKKAGQYTAASLETEGFIHLSQASQVVRVANLFYRGVKDLVLLEVNEEKLRSTLKYEPVEQDVYPHLFGPLNLDAVMAVYDFPEGPQGFEMPLKR